MDTTKEINLQDGFLEGKLKDDKGEWHTDKIRLAPDFTLDNKDGKFVKNPIDHDWENNAEDLKLLPGGNWHRNAKNFSLKGGLLTAKLKDEKGQWKEAQV